MRESAGHPPLFVIVLGAVSFLGGTSTLTHQVVELTLDVAAVGVIGLLAREIGGNRIGAIAGFMAALYPRFWATEGEVLSESLYALTVATMLLLTYRFIRVPSWRRAAWLGVAVGLVPSPAARASSSSHSWSYRWSSCMPEPPPLTAWSS